MHVGNTQKWKLTARRKTALDDQASRFKHHEYCPDAHQDTHRDSNKSADVS